MKSNNIELVRLINSKWFTELEKDKDLEIVMYEPFTDEYWKEEYKIVFCNLEPGGKLEKNRNLFDLYSFSYFLENNNPTIKGSALFLYYLYNKLHGNDINKNQKDLIKNNKALLIDTMKKVTYMNLLRDAGTSQFNERYFWNFFSNDDNKKYTKDSILALEPDIFIVTSVGKTLIEQLFNKKFDKKHSFVCDNTLFVNLGHPRTWDNDYIPNNVDMIYDNLIKYNILK
jgi:hypothetical protein